MTPKYFGWRGLGPDLLQMIVVKAHASKLRVSTHIESAADFHTALLAGVDEINHMPGFRYRDDVKPHQLSEFEITDSDAKRAAKQGTVWLLRLVVLRRSIPMEKMQRFANAGTN